MFTYLLNTHEIRKTKYTSKKISIEINSLTASNKNIHLKGFLDKSRKSKGSEWCSSVCNVSRTLAVILFDLEVNSITGPFLQEEIQFQRRVLSGN